MTDSNRRRFLTLTAGVVTGGLAGCLGGTAGSQSDAETTGSASFFVFGDILGHVAGDVATTETLVPVGQHGHGWEPGPDIQGRIYESALFVHGMPGFQPWADDVLTSLEADGADVVTVSAAADVELHEIGADGNHAHESHEEEEHHESGEHHDEEAHESGEHHDDGTHGEDGDHDHGSIDPHFWMDPHRVATATETVRDALQRVDEANAEAYAANAESFRNALTDLDETYESTLESRERDVVLVAGHNAYGYLADRYGFEVVALTGLSPDEEPSPQDIERAQETIDEHGIRHVLADPLESDRAATQLVNETAAEEVLPLTAIPGRTDEWDERGWGYLEIMAELNLPSLQTALGAK
ncbi:metal ABC transporter substrate-binding protein [Haloferax namakaokahaiae]|uniref:Metal ABC transporter substrate-binding protein n=1 Tax=Haloferax namakaokahaiae TaxID=1748331 RepID=A0ABD5ZKB5_9EURY